MRIEILRAFQHVACEDSAMGVMADERRLGGLVGTRERWAIIWALVYTCMYRKIHELGKQDRFQPVFRVCSLPPLDPSEDLQRPAPKDEGYEKRVMRLSRMHQEPE